MHLIFVCLKPMAEAAKKALEVDKFKVVADAGYSNGEQVAHCEAAGMVPYVPVMRTVNNQDDGTLFGRADFRYEADSDTYVCPGDRNCCASTPMPKIVTPCIRLRPSTAAPAR